MDADQHHADGVGPAMPLQVGEFGDQQGRGNDRERIGQQEVFLLEAADHSNVSTPQSTSISTATCTPAATRAGGWQSPSRL